MIIHSDELYHIGMYYNSGRYPRGSGEDPYQHEFDFMANVKQLKDKGMSEADIADAYKVSIRTLRSMKTIAKNKITRHNIDMCHNLKKKGMSNQAIADRLHMTEGNVRLYLKKSNDEQLSALETTTNMLRESVDQKGLIDVGHGVERYMNVSAEKLSAAVEVLKGEGYNLYNTKVTQPLTKKDTRIKFLAPPEMEWKDAIQHITEISMPLGTCDSFNDDIYHKIEPPTSVDSSRVAIRYAEDGGKDKDGVIEIRRGCEDLNLGGARYAQVRIAVDGKRYLKGMAMYSDNVPEGYDIIFNTNKDKDVPKMEVLKELKKDPSNPFGAVIKQDDELNLVQRHYIGKDGKEHLSALNIVHEEGDWGNWSKSLSSQMLSKQSPALAQKQLALTYDKKEAEFNEIMSLTNPVLKNKLLLSFADGCDSAASSLKAAALPRQSSYVILPVPELKDNEIYAPSFKNGESVVLIRYPHAGLFEIPSLVVNNLNPNAKKALGDGIDSVGIPPKVAQQLSGADFDGDTVIVIPNNDNSILFSKARQELIDFDPNHAYKGYKGMHIMTDAEKGQEMGKISNLITDMTIAGAKPDEIVRAVKHSMVVIDAKKHELDYQKSFDDNRIAELKTKYQGSARSGASTIISRSSSKVYVPERKERYEIDPETGKKIFTPTGYEHYKRVPIKEKIGPGKNDYRIVDYKYVKEPNQQTITKMDAVDDAFDLVSKVNGKTTRIEYVYAAHANRLKALANKARIESLNAGTIEYDPAARKIYHKEVEELEAALRTAEMNAPLERKATIIANTRIKSIFKDNPELYENKEQAKKVRVQEVKLARLRTGAHKGLIRFTDKQWEAIQAGAVRKTFFEKLILNADEDHLKQMAMPRDAVIMSPSKVNTARSMLANGYTYDDIADQLDVSVSTLKGAVLEDRSK